MSAMALLPDCLLSDILCLAAASADISTKIAVAQVSPHWRRVALSSPLLWTYIHLSTRQDCHHVPLALPRCGPSALLYIVVSGSFLRRDAAADLEAAMHALEPYAARIRSLNTSAPTDALLNVNLDFPVLHTLRARAAVTNDRPLTRICLKAPALRVLDLTRCSPVGLEDLLSQELEEVRLDCCPGVQQADFVAVLARCVNVSHLTLRCEESEVQHTEVGTRWETSPLVHLDTLELSLPCPLIITVLDHVVLPDTVLPAVTVSFPFAQYPHDTMLLMDVLLRRVGPITEFVLDAYSVRLSDDAGHLRVIALRDGVFAFGPLWPLHRTHETIRDMTIPLALWSPLADDIAAYGYRPEAVTRLRVEVDLEYIQFLDIESTGEWRLPLRGIPLPRLRRVELGVVRLGTRITRLPALLAVRILEAITCNADQLLEVEIDAQVAEVQETRDLFEREGGGRWQLLN